MKYGMPISRIKKCPEHDWYKFLMLPYLTKRVQSPKVLCHACSPHTLLKTKSWWCLKCISYPSDETKFSIPNIAGSIGALVAMIPHLEGRLWFHTSLIHNSSASYVSDGRWYTGASAISQLFQLKGIQDWALAIEKHSQRVGLHFVFACTASFFYFVQYLSLRRQIKCAIGTTSCHNNHRNGKPPQKASILPTLDLELAMRTLACNLTRRIPRGLTNRDTWRLRDHFTRVCSS